MPRRHSNKDFALQVNALVNQAKRLTRRLQYLDPPARLQLEQAIARHPAGNKQIPPEPLRSEGITNRVPMQRSHGGRSLKSAR